MSGYGPNAHDYAVTIRRSERGRFRPYSGRTPRSRTLPTAPISDKGACKAAIEAGKPERRELFADLDGTAATWTDGTRETIDAIILATGYRPDVSYLQTLGALDVTGAPRQLRGLSRTCPGLGYVGLEWQRSFSSATLRGVARDAHHVVRHLASPARITAPQCCAPLRR